MSAILPEDGSMIAATADGGYRFAGWIGDVPAEDLTNNPLTLVMDQPRTIQAEFTSISGQAKVWSGTGAWSDYNNWTPVGAPGPNDTIIIADGNMLLPAARTVKSATLNSGATVVFTNWNTALTATEDVMTIAGTVTLPPPFVHPTAMSNRVWIICRDFSLSASGVINAPVIPGSGGGGIYNDHLGHGGGAVWIDASRDVVIDGQISANGGGVSYNGGGAGGSIFIIAAHSFTGGATGIIRANGGNRGTGYTLLGGGAGGRIAIWHRASTMNPASRAILLAGGTVDRLEITPTLPTYLGIATANAATSSYAPPEDGTVVFLRELPPAGTTFLIR